MVEKDHIQPEVFKDRIVFMLTYNDIDWSQRGNEEKWYATLAHKPDGLWNKVADEMLIVFAERDSKERVLHPEDLCKAKAAGKHRRTTKRSLRLQSYYYESLSPSISSVFTEP